MPKPEPRRIDQVRTGLFKIRLVRNGPWVAAAIQHDEATGWYALIDGHRQGNPCHDPDKSPEVQRVWLFGHEIASAEYRRMTRPDRSVSAQQPINLSTAPTIF
jgi:hypothetical protein